MATEDENPSVSEPEAHGIDGLLRGYSRWRLRRLTRIVQVPLSMLALESLFLSLAVLLDAVVLPWIVAILAGTFSYALFAVLLIPAFAAEAIVYRRLRRGGVREGSKA